MTLEELAAQVEKLTGELTTVKSNNDKLVKEKRDALSRAETAEAAIDSSNTAALSDLDKAIKRAEKAEKSIKDIEDRAVQAETNLRNTRADTALTTALAAANIDSKAMPFLTKALRSDLQFNDDGEPQLNGKSVADYVKEFTSPKGEGHQFVRAPNNSGGAAMGYDGTKAPRMTKENFNYTEFAKIALENPAEANAIADAVGKPQLKVSL